MRETIKKYRTRILVWTLILLYLFLALWFHPELHLQQGEPIPVVGESHQAQFSIDGIEKINDQEGTYRLKGWVFLKGDEPIDQGFYTRKVVLSSKEDNYFFPTKAIERKDIQQTFADLNMDLVNVGFVSWIKIGSLPAGSYKIGFEYKSIQDDSTYYVETNWTIERTSDELKLIGPTIFERVIFKIKDQWK